MATNAPLSPDLLDSILSFEAGQLDEEATITLFQHLIDTGLAWQLQGAYGRFAMQLIKAGLCRPANTTRS